MPKLRFTRTVLTGIMIAIFFVAVSPVTKGVFAHEGHEHSGDHETTTPGHREDDHHKHGSDDPAKATKKAQIEAAAEKTRLKDVKLKTCQNREKRIAKLMSNLTNRATRQVMVFNQIAERTQNFYMEKGKTLSGYESLVAEVYAKKAAVEAAIAKTESTRAEFSCDADDPKGVSTVFREHLKAQNEAMKAYKTAVKNLIVGVKSVHATTKGNQ